ncbi:MAG: acetyltransferase [Proteobacteria bacterium]|nr:acetyltransferase [Pseudomonadota bacterium]
MADGTARPLLIFPFNGNAVEALACLDDGYALAGFVDDTPAKHGRSPFGPTVFARSVLADRPDCAVLAVPGSPTSYRQRREVIAGLGVEPARWARVIHPRASVSPLARIGRNVLIMAGVVVTANAVIGDHVCILPNTVIHHDAVIGDYALVGANVTVAGSTRIGDNAYVGSGSRLMNGITIGAGALIGLGSNVIRDVPAGARVAGNPARPVRSSKSTPSN